MFNDLTACLLRVERQVMPVAGLITNGCNNSYINTNAVTFVITIGNTLLFLIVTNVNTLPYFRKILIFLTNFRRLIN